jgi:hypothetical protein
MGDKNILEKRADQFGNPVKPGSIPFLTGRPDREKVIAADDLLDLRINLNTSTTVEDFLKNI